MELREERRKWDEHLRTLQNEDREAARLLKTELRERERELRKEIDIARMEHINLLKDKFEDARDESHYYISTIQQMTSKAFDTVAKFAPQ